jgi:hypothetical protein
LRERERVREGESARVVGEKSQSKISNPKSKILNRFTAAPHCGYAVKLRLLSSKRKQPTSLKNLVALPPLRPKLLPTAMDSYRQTGTSSLEANGEF